MWYEYSRWDGSQKPWQADPHKVMDKMADSLIQGGDLLRALRMVLQGGVEGQRGEDMKGIQSLLEKLRRMRKRELDRYNPDTSLQKVKETLERIIGKERRALEEQLGGAEGEGTSPDFSSRGAQGKLDYLKGLPEDVGQRVEGLRSYSFVDQEAREEFRRLLEMLQHKALETYFQNMKKALEEITWEKAQQLKEMLRDLNRMFRDKARGGTPDFDDFMGKHGRHFDLPAGADFEQFMRMMQRNLGSLTSLMESMSHEMREELSRLMESSIFDEELKEELGELGEHLRSAPGFVQLVKSYPFRGKEELNLDAALKVMERLQGMEELEKSLQESVRSAQLENVDESKVRELLGDESLREFRGIKKTVDLLQEAGYIRKSGKDLQLTPEGMRRIGFKAMRDIFSSLKLARRGLHVISRSGGGGSPIEETKGYEFGDHFSLNVGRSLMNAIVRGGRVGGGIRMEPGDFEVHKTEYLSHCCTVIMIDMSGSMETFDRFSAAKKVAIALECLIRVQFPKDTLHIVGFYTHAREIKKEELPFIQPKPFGYNPYMPADLMSMQWGGYLNLEIDQRDIDNRHSNVPESFTNIQQGLRCSAGLLARENCANKQIIMITDGEPTAHSEGGRLYLRYPPSRQTILETLREVERCTLRGITINTFMLNRDYFLEKFVDQITRINRGRAFFTTPDRIGEYIFVDYLRNRRKRIA